jgi:hypothetical protein
MNGQGMLDKWGPERNAYRILVGKARRKETVRKTKR